MAILLTIKKMRRIVYRLRGQGCRVSRWVRRKVRALTETEAVHSGRTREIRGWTYAGGANASVFGGWGEKRENKVNLGGVRIIEKLHSAFKIGGACRLYVGIACRQVPIELYRGTVSPGCFLCAYGGSWGDL